jgi:hypothetical protein
MRRGPLARRFPTAGGISLEDETALYSYRGKGGTRGRRELPKPACEAPRATLADAGLSLAQMEMDTSASLWRAAAGPRGVTGATFYPVQAVPRGRRAPAGGALHPPPHCCQTSARCRLVDRGREFVPRPQLPCRSRASTCGGSRPRWTRRGRTWRWRSACNDHLGAERIHPVRRETRRRWSHHGGI